MSSAVNALPLMLTMPVASRELQEFAQRNLHSRALLSFPSVASFPAAGLLFCLILLRDHLFLFFTLLFSTTRPGRLRIVDCVLSPSSSFVERSDVGLEVNQAARSLIKGRRDFRPS